PPPPRRGRPRAPPRPPPAAPAPPTHAPAPRPAAAPHRQWPPPYATPYADRPRSSPRSPAAPFHQAQRTAAGIPDSRPASARASLEPCHGETPRSWHIVGKPRHTGRQLVKEPAPREPPDATTTAPTP